jgi:hypothetical protein
MREGTMKYDPKNDVSEDDGDFELIEGIDEHELEIVATAGHVPNWRRIDLIKEKIWLKEQLQDFNDW